MHYKGARRALPEIARELGVDAVVEGSVVARSGNRMRIRVQLIEAATDSHLWAETYERQLEDTLALLAQVARTIAGHVQVKLTGLEQTSLSRAKPVNGAAYEAYLKGGTSGTSGARREYCGPSTIFSSRSQTHPAMPRLMQAWPMHGSCWESSDFGLRPRRSRRRSQRP
jgi:hypothetical protein